LASTTYERAANTQRVIALQTQGRAFLIGLRLHSLISFKPASTSLAKVSDFLNKSLVTLDMAYAYGIIDNVMNITVNKLTFRKTPADVAGEFSATLVPGLDCFS
jgi:hypothetical protein